MENINRIKAKTIEEAIKQVKFNHRNIIETEDPFKEIAEKLKEITVIKEHQAKLIEQLKRKLKDESKH